MSGSNIEQDIAYVLIRPTEEGVASVPVSFSKGGVTFVHICPSQRGMVSAPFVPVKEVWLLCLGGGFRLLQL